MTANSLVRVFFDTAAPQDGDTYRGAWYTNNSADFLASITNATFEYYLTLDGNGSHAFGGMNYYLLSERFATGSATLSTVAESADFGGGVINGRVTQFTLNNVPEPHSLAVLALSALLMSRGCRRRMCP
jgi:hypothetical protein